MMICVWLHSTSLHAAHGVDGAHHRHAHTSRKLLKHSSRFTDRLHGLVEIKAVTLQACTHSDGSGTTASALSVNSHTIHVQVHVHVHVPSFTIFFDIEIQIVVTLTLRRPGLRWMPSSTGAPWKRSTTRPSFAAAARGAAGAVGPLAAMASASQPWLPCAPRAYGAAPQSAHVAIDSKTPTRLPSEPKTRDVPWTPSSRRPSCPATGLPAAQGALAVQVQPSRPCAPPSGPRARHVGVRAPHAETASTTQLSVHSARVIAPAWAIARRHQWVSMARRHYVLTAATGAPCPRCSRAQSCRA